MPFTTLIQPDELASRLADPNLAVIDCRFSLADTGYGRREYADLHITGSVYAHLDDDLSGPVVSKVTGRHPLPSVADFERTLASWGIDPGAQVIAYDDMGGPIAARLWWMLRWVGHGAVAVLDGGWQRWRAEGRPVRSDHEERGSRSFTASPRMELLAAATEVAARLGDPSAPLLDARAGERYRGEVEPLDPVAGHIPVAISAPFNENLDANGRFLAPDRLRQRFEGLLGDAPAEQSISYCGSGVTACHNLLAMAHAGLTGGRLYAGSWSHWITDEERSVETG